MSLYPVRYETIYTYKKLCELFKEDVLSGSQQRVQLKQWQKKYDIERIAKDRYIIHKEYNDVEVIEQQTYFKSKQYVSAILCTLLNNMPNNVISVNMGQLLEILNMVNKNFRQAKYNPELIMPHILEPDEEDIYDLPLFIENVEKMSKRIVKDVLKDMEERRLIMQIDYIPMLAYKVKTGEKTYITQIHEADNEKERPIFIEAQRQVIAYFGYEEWTDCITNLNYKQWKKAKELMTAFLKEELKIDYFFYNYKIVLNKEGIIDEITHNFTQMQRSFNIYMQDRILNSRMSGLKIIPANHKKRYVEVLVDNQAEEIKQNG